jgi:hypothetical protein
MLDYIPGILEIDERVIRRVVEVRDCPGQKQGKYENNSCSNQGGRSVRNQKKGLSGL